MSNAAEALGQWIFRGRRIAPIDTKVLTDTFVQSIHLRVSG